MDNPQPVKKIEWPTELNPVMVQLKPVMSQHDDWVTLPASAQAMPFYFDYAYAYGPHSGKACDCPECTSFNDGFQNHAKLMKLLDKVKNEALNTMRQCSGNFRHPEGTIDVNIALQIMVNLCRKHIAEYQQEMVKKVQTIQLEHTATLQRVIDQHNKMAEVRAKRDLEKHKAGEHDGRLFRVGEKEETV